MKKAKLGPKCQIHNSVMTYGRYSKREIFDRAQVCRNGNWYYCISCANEIERKLNFVRAVAEDFETEFYATYGFDRGFIKYKIERYGDDGREDFYEIEFSLNGKPFKTMIV